METGALSGHQGEVPILRSHVPGPLVKQRSFYSARTALLRLLGMCGVWHVGFPLRGTCLESLPGVGLGVWGDGRACPPLFFSPPLTPLAPTQAGSGPDGEREQLARISRGSFQGEVGASLLVPLFFLSPPLFLPLTSHKGFWGDMGAGVLLGVFRQSGRPQTEAQNLASRSQNDLPGPTHPKGDQASEKASLNHLTSLSLLPSRVG